MNSKGQAIPLKALLTVKRDKSLKKIQAGKEGEYIPITFTKTNNDIHAMIQQVNTYLKSEGVFEAGFTGAYFSNKKMLKEIALILGISLLLLYFILAAQFESLLLPLIVLSEVPIAIFGALLVLKLTGESINLMSMIGIIVMSGIIINDSILKIDTINRLLQEGNGLLKAIMLGGKRRLKPILMTSITTIFALLPFLFMHGMGAELQKPLAYTVIGGMIIGTLVSLFFIPLSYYNILKLQQPEYKTLEKNG
jgi:multidrug efflux pump subunit AcrB